MAGIADDALVRSFKVEFGLFVMIETPDFPVIADVAELALVAEGLLVIIILLMTRIAFNFCFLKIAGCVALLTGKTRVSTQ